MFCKPVPNRHRDLPIIVLLIPANQKKIFPKNVFIYCKGQFAIFAESGRGRPFFD